MLKKLEGQGKLIIISSKINPFLVTGARVISFCPKNENINELNVFGIALLIFANDLGNIRTKLFTRTINIILQYRVLNTKTIINIITCHIEFYIVMF